MSKQIKIRVYPDGRIVSETVGIKGKACLNQMDDIEKITKAKVINSEFTDDYDNKGSGQAYYEEEYIHNENKN